MTLEEMLDWLNAHTQAVILQANLIGDGWELCWCVGKEWDSDQGPTPFEVCDAVVRKLARR